MQLSCPPTCPVDMAPMVAVKPTNQTSEEQMIKITLPGLTLACAYYIPSL